MVRNYSLLPVAEVRVSGPAAVAALAADPLVVSVAPNRTFTMPAPIRQSGPAASTPADLGLIDDVKAQASGDLGEGVAVAVLDDGTDYKDAVFGGCANPGDVGCDVIAYKDFAKPPSGGLTFNGHGTNVAAQVLKVAPVAKLVIGNVFHETGGAISASDADIMAGLQWVLSEQMKQQVHYALRAVNMSLGTPFTYHTATCSSPYTGVFKQLLHADVQPVLAAGNTANDGTTFTTGIDTPACTAGALVVGAVYDQSIKDAVWNQKIGSRTSDCTDHDTSPGQITCFTQGGPLLNILAPGVHEIAAGIDETGTSQATPLVTGAIAALASGAPSQPAASITASLLSVGKLITDPRTKLKRHLLDVYAAELRTSGDTAVIQSGNVGMGIVSWGNLNVPDQVPSAQGTTTYGLRYLPTNNEFTGPGCPCEGWGVADTVTGADGYADQSAGTAGLSLVRFVYTATTATSTVTIGSSFQVTNAYSPVPTVPDLYQDQVVIKNISGATLPDVVYRRLVDWDMEPTAFDEYVTIEGFGNSPALIGTTNDGFDSADPLSPPDNLGATGNFYQYGPLDQGAQFNFDFGALKSGRTITFTEYWGAASSEAQAGADLAKVGVEAYSLGEPSSSTDGTPNTAILGFSGIGGKIISF